MRVLTGDETGLLKAVDVEAMRIVVLGQQTRKKAIKAMAWTGAEPGAFAVARADGVVTLWQDGKVPRKVRELGKAGGEGVVGMYAVNTTSMLLGHNDGKIEMCAMEGEGVEAWTVRGPVSCLGVQGNLLAASGKERDLAVWDLERMGMGGEEAPLWEAKNVKHDKLDLRLPVWGTALTFLDSPHVVAVGTAYKQLRVYDTRVQRRPLRSVDLDNKQIEGHRVTAISGGVDVRHDVVVGDAAGTVLKLDTRTMKMIGRLEGPAGSVRAIVRHRTLPVVALGGLDRMMRVFDLKKGVSGEGRSKRAENHKFYLKQRLNALLLCDEGRVVVRGGKKEEEGEEERGGEMMDEGDMEGMDDDLVSLSEGEEEDEEEEEEEERKKAKPRQVRIERIRGEENGHATRGKTARQEEESDDDDDDEDDEEEDSEDEEEGGNLEMNVMGMEGISDDDDDEEEEGSEDEEEESEEEEEEEKPPKRPAASTRKSSRAAQPPPAPTRQSKRSKH